jgi:2-polyprenyl-6-methoxyphenol hydroxylase-like FAD-dependent oxidoreductase
MTTDFDVIVVGARCGGAPTAMLLARAGHRVLLVDRATFPSDTLSTHYIHQPGVAALARWGLLDEVARSGCPPIRSQTLDVGPFAVRGSPPPVDGVAEGYCVRRTVLDAVLVDAAAEAGAEVRQGLSVQELLRDGGRVTGIRGRVEGGPAVSETARIVVGADGVHSLVARAVGAPSYRTHPSLTCAYYSYWSDVAASEVELYARPSHQVIAAPTNDGQVMVIAYWPRAEFPAVRHDVEGQFHAVLDLVPQLHDRVRTGTRTEPFRGTGHLPNYFRRPHGDGWALVGDAGYHKDPILALGISDAFRDAELLAEAVDAGLTGRTPLPVALAACHRRRDEAADQGYQNTVQLAALQPPPPEMQQLLEALQHDREQAGRFFGTLIGTVPAAEFFDPANLSRLLDRQPAPPAVAAAGGT